VEACGKGEEVDADADRGRKCQSGPGIERQAIDFGSGVDVTRGASLSTVAYLCVLVLVQIFCFSTMSG
jgi:hypothetical protein